MKRFSATLTTILWSLLTLLAACGPSAQVAKPVSFISGGQGSKTRAEKLQERLDTLTLLSEKDYTGVYHIFTVQWTPLLDLMIEGDELELERTAPNGSIEHAVMQSNSAQYKDSGIPATVGLTYRYRLVLVSEGTTYHTSFFAQGTTSVDPVPTKPAAPQVVQESGQTDMVRTYLNGFKVRWKDASDNETKFEIKKCVWEEIETEYQDGSTSTYTECVSTGNLIVVDTSSNASSMNEREIFDPYVSPSIYNDRPSSGFVSDGYCYSIRAVNGAGASAWTETECERFE